MPAAFSKWVHGDKERPMRCSPPDIKALSFVGSTRSPVHLRHAARNGKRVQALGGPR